MCLRESKVGGSTGAEFGVQVHMKRNGRFVTMRSSGPEICGSEIGRKSRGGIGNVGFSIAVDELYTGLLPEIEGYTILKRFNMIDLVSQF